MVYVEVSVPRSETLAFGSPDSLRRYMQEGDLTDLVLREDIFSRVTAALGVTRPSLREDGSKAYGVHIHLDLDEIVTPKEANAVADNMLEFFFETARGSKTIFRRGGNFDPVPYVDRAIGLSDDPKEQSQYFAKAAHVLVHLLEEDVARIYVGRALFHDRKNSYAHEIAGHIHKKEGNYSKAAEHYQKAAELTGHVDHFKQLAEMQKVAGRHRDASRTHFTIAKNSLVRAPVKSVFDALAYGLGSIKHLVLGMYQVGEANRWQSF